MGPPCFGGRPTLPALGPFLEPLGRPTGCFPSDISYQIKFNVSVFEWRKSTEKPGTFIVLRGFSTTDGRKTANLTLSSNRFQTQLGPNLHTPIVGLPQAPKTSTLVLLVWVFILFIKCLVMYMMPRIDNRTNQENPNRLAKHIGR